MKDEMPDILEIESEYSSPLGFRQTLNETGFHLANISIIITLLTMLLVRGNRAVYHLVVVCQSCQAFYSEWRSKRFADARR